MKLRSLRIQGFKSFADTTRIKFHDGITAVVGPNGCGKSNIGEAIRWVLGEQRPTAIRGAKMDEVIFQGTVSRRPVNRGSVTMVVSNEDGALPAPFAEVEIGRTVYRDGGSDYTLNRSACRLRDIVDLCRDTGLGANAYSVIEAKMIDAILSERADERQALFQEAAGIGKYKDRRRAALRRLEVSEVDVQRVEDVIGEVATKVRSLARQKGRAQRWEKLRARRLAIEVAVVRSDLEALNASLEEVDRRLEAERATGTGVRARLSAADAQLEQARLAKVEAERKRVDVADRYEKVRSEVGRVETALAVTRERITAAERRRGQIGTERDRLKTLAARSQEELERDRSRHAQSVDKLDVIRADLKQHRINLAGVRDRLDVVRPEVRELEQASREATKELARTEGKRIAARVQAEELGRRLNRLARSADDSASALSELGDQGDLFASRRTASAAAATVAARAFDAARQRMESLRGELKEARERERLAEAKCSALEAEVAALRRGSAAEEGTEALVAAAQKAFPGAVVGVLADFVRVESSAAPVVDDVLAGYGSALVVRSKEDLRRIETWYHSKAGAPARLVLLPGGRPPPTGSKLPRGVTVEGEGAGWIHALLEGAELPVPGPSPARGNDGNDASGASWGWTDARGARHLVPPGPGEGALERRKRIQRAEADLEAARSELRDSSAGRRALEKAHGECETETDAASERVLETRDQARAAEMEAEAHSHRQQTLGNRREKLARQLAGTEAAREKALERKRVAEETRTRLASEERALAATLAERREALAAVDSEWEAARDAESALAIRAAKLESRSDRLQDRISDLSQALQRTSAESDALAKESAELQKQLDELRKTNRSGAERLQALFAESDKAARALSDRDEALEEASEAVASKEREVSEARRAERNAVEARHSLELKRRDILNQAARIQERLEAEWNRPLEALLDEAGADDDAAEGTVEDLRTELAEVAERLSRMGPVNMLAVEEHAEESARLEFLSQQRDDLVAARDDLRAAIAQINATATELFTTSFEAIRRNFRNTFQHLFSGGEANLTLSDPDSPIESAIEIHAAPRGKRTQRIDLLSGGERALAALSLLFGIYLVKPSPFCVLDEVDAPLDESNIGRFIRLLEGFKSQTQFVVITHNPRTIEAADWIYGVTMEEPGVSAVVGVRLEKPA